MTGKRDIKNSKPIDRGWAWVVMFGMFKNNLEKMNIIAPEVIEGQAIQWSQKW
jgi:hypothetical protein